MCLSVSQMEKEKKRYDAPDLTWPSHGAQALQVDSRAPGPHLKGQLDVRRQGPGGQRGPGRLGVLVLACQTGSLQAYSYLGGQGTAPPGPPTPFCKSC